MLLLSLVLKTEVESSESGLRFFQEPTRYVDRDSGELVIKRTTDSCMHPPYASGACQFVFFSGPRARSKQRGSCEGTTKQHCVGALLSNTWDFSSFEHYARMPKGTDLAFSRTRLLHNTDANVWRIYTYTYLDR